MNKWGKIAFLIFLSTCLACTDNSKKLEKEISGKVIGIKDGDTIVILLDQKPFTIRLAHIDCPEVKKRQPFGQAAKKFTSNNCFNQVVTIKHNGKYDRYKRLIGEVINEKGVNINIELVKSGLAWHFKKYSNSEDYFKLEITARENKIGLWSELNPTPPWDWR